jgi:threonine/homoserine/homoserine lactone efflux protein
MGLEIWMAYMVAAEIILVIPGPTIILVISQAITHGRRSVVPLVAGVTCGDATAMIFSLLGLGTIMSASAMLFTLTKWAGAVYLVYLGLKTWRARAENGAWNSSRLNGGSRGELFKSAYIVTALNPKGIAFFVAFLPQFVDPRGAYLTQLFILGTTFLVLALINAALYAIFAGTVRDTLRQPRARRWFNRCGGSALIGAGVVTAAMQRAN